MDEKMRQEIALHRWAVVAEAANGRLASSERGAVVRVIAAREHAHPDGTMRRYSRGTIDRWLRAWHAGGIDGLRLELPARSAAQIALDLVLSGTASASPSGPSAGSCAAPGCTGPRR